MKERREKAIVFIIIVNMPVKSFEKRIGPERTAGWIGRSRRELCAFFI